VERVEHLTTSILLNSCVIDGFVFITTTVAHRQTTRTRTLSRDAVHPFLVTSLECIQLII